MYVKRLLIIFLTRYIEAGKNEDADSFNVPFVYRRRCMVGPVYFSLISWLDGTVMYQRSFLSVPFHFVLCVFIVCWINVPTGLYESSILRCY